MFEPEGVVVLKGKGPSVENVAAYVFDGVVEVIQEQYPGRSVRYTVEVTIQETENNIFIDRETRDDLNCLVHFLNAGRMNRVLLLLMVLLVPAAPAGATFSIVGIDPATGDLGIAGDRHGKLPSGPWCPGRMRVWERWRPRARVNGGNGTRALELHRQGLTAQQVIDRLFAEDAFPGKRRPAACDRRRQR